MLRLCRLLVIFGDNVSNQVFTGQDLTSWNVLRPSRTGWRDTGVSENGHRGRLSIIDGQMNDEKPLGLRFQMILDTKSDF